MEIIFGNSRSFEGSCKFCLDSEKFSRHFYIDYVLFVHEADIEVQLLQYFYPFLDIYAI